MWSLGVILSLLAAISAFELFKRRSPEGYARALANAQLRAYRAAKQRNPTASARELYQLALQTRQGYVPGTVGDLISQAETNARAANMRFGFRLVVIEMATEEFVARTGNSASPHLRDISFAVCSVIHDDF